MFAKVEGIQHYIMVIHICDAERERERERERGREIYHNIRILMHLKFPSKCRDFTAPLGQRLRWQPRERPGLLKYFYLVAVRCKDDPFTSDLMNQLQPQQLEPPADSEQHRASPPGDA